jgi:plastocyanin
VQQAPQLNRTRRLGGRSHRCVLRALGFAGRKSRLRETCAGTSWRCGLSVALVIAAGCTPGSFAPGSAANGSGPFIAIDVDLTTHPAGTSPAGTAAGYAPLVTTLTVGQSVRFTNGDGFAHTATSIAGNPGAFPTAYPFTSAALNSTGATLSGGFSSGNLQAGASSQVLLADKTGAYVFGCFYHYGAPMRAVIVVH